MRQEVHMPHRTVVTALLVSGWSGTAKGIATVLFLALMLVGCAGQARFTKPGAIAQDFETDKYRCDQELGVNTAVGDPSTKIAYMLSGMYRDQIERCLRARGWAREN
jgi:hypothetical protein